MRDRRTPAPARATLREILGRGLLFAIWAVAETLMLLDRLLASAVPG